MLTVEDVINKWIGPSSSTPPVLVRIDTGRRVVPVYAITRAELCAVIEEARKIGS